MRGYQEAMIPPSKRISCMGTKSRECEKREKNREKRDSLKGECIKRERKRTPCTNPKIPSSRSERNKARERQVEVRIPILGEREEREKAQIRWSVSLCGLRPCSEAPIFKQPFSYNLYGKNPVLVTENRGIPCVSRRKNLRETGGKFEKPNGRDDFPGPFHANFFSRKFSSF